MPCNCEPICVASLMRCDSPPLRLLEERLSVRYVNPTSSKNCSRSLISFSTSLAMEFCLALNLFSTSANHTASLSRLSELNSAIFFSSTLNQRLSFRSLVPLQVGQGFSSINFSTHSRIASVVPLPVNQRFSMGMIPSKAPGPPPSPERELFDDSGSKVDAFWPKSPASFVPVPSGFAYSKIFSAVADKVLIGLSKLILFFLATASTFLYM